MSTQQLMLPDMPVIVTLHASISKEQLHETGSAAGLEGKALAYFCYYNEVKLTVNINPTTGEVVKAAVE